MFSNEIQQVDEEILKIAKENLKNNITNNPNKSNGRNKSYIYKYRYLIVIFIILIIIILAVSFKKVEVPNIVGLSEEEAISKTEEQGLSLVVNTEEYSSNIEKGHIISQTPKTNSKIKKGSNIIAVVSKGEEPEDVKQERLKQEELQNRIPNTIKKYAEIVRAKNDGTVKYNSYTTYKTTTSGEKVYKVKYSTSSSNNSYSRIYYYQLLSLDSENKEVVKSTKLYLFHETTVDGKVNEYGDNYAMEYEYEQLWGV